MKEGNQQFRSWLWASTLDLTKKMLVRVTGYEEEVSRENEINSSVEGTMG